MSLGTNLQRRGARYHVRVRVSVELVSRMGKSEITRALGTADPREAKRLAPAVVAEIHALFEQERAKQAPARRHFSPDEIHDLAREFYQTELRADEAERQQGVQDIAELCRAPFAEAVRQDLGLTGKYHHVYYWADEIFRRNSWSVDRESGPYRQLCQALMRVLAEAQKRFSERDRGEFGGQPADPLLTQPASEAGSRKARAGETIAELHKRYLAERGISNEWKLTNRAIIRLFADHVGHDMSVASITRQHVRNWKTALLRYPSRGSLVNPSASFQEIIRHNEEANRPTLSPRTVNKYLSALSSFMDWLERNEFIATNPTVGTSLAKDREAGGRDPFSVDDLRILFASPLYTGARDAERQLHLSGSIRIRDHRFWLPLLGLWTGARIGELVQLETADVLVRDGVHLISISDTGGRSLKSSAAKRIVPLHSELMRLGFLQMVDKRRQEGSKQIFPSVKPDSLGRPSSEYSKAFSKYIKRIGVKVDARLSFHSFRHAFADQLRIAGYSDTQLGVLIGHSQHSVTAGYGRMAQFGPRERSKMIEGVQYEGLDLSHLRPTVDALSRA